MKKLLSLIAILGTTTFVHAQEPVTFAEKGREKIESGFQNWSLDEMKEGLAILERAAMIDPENTDISYWFAYGHYRMAIKTLYSGDDKKEELAEKYIDKGISVLEGAIKKNPRSADHLALLATLMGMSIQFNPISGMWKGPKSAGYFEDAAAADPLNPRVMHLWGISKMNTPSMFGGGAEKALPLFETAVKLYEKEKDRALKSPLEPRWGFDECYSFYGNALMTVNNKEKAKLMYEKALALNPEHRLAKSGLKKLGGSQ